MPTRTVTSTVTRKTSRTSRKNTTAKENTMSENDTNTTNTPKVTDVVPAQKDVTTSPEKVTTVKTKAEAQNVANELFAASEKVGADLQAIAAGLAWAYAHGVPEKLDLDYGSFLSEYLPLLSDSEFRAGRKFARAFVTSYHALTGQTITANKLWSEAVGVSTATISNALRDARTAGELPESEKAKATKEGKDAARESAGSESDESDDTDVIEPTKITSATGATVSVPVPDGVTPEQFARALAVLAGDPELIAELAEEDSE